MVLKSGKLLVRVFVFQEFELCRALDENEKLIEKSLSKQGPGEVKITQEIDKLTKRLTQLNSELDKVIKEQYDSKCDHRPLLFDFR